MDQYRYYHSCLFIQQPMTNRMMGSNGNHERCNSTFTPIEADDIAVDNNKDGTMYTITYCPTGAFTISCPSHS